MQDSDVIRGELDRLGDAIVAIVTEGFEQTRRVVLLSNLGQNLLKAGVDYRSILDRTKLAEFIRAELSDRVTLVSVPGKDKVIGIHPAGVDLSALKDPFGQSGMDVVSRAEAVPKQDKRPLLHSQVWFAFSHFLAEGQARVLELQPEPLYRDFPESAELPGAGYPVDRNLIVPVGSLAKPERDARIYENITRWAEDGRIPLDGLLAKKVERGERRNLLDELLQALSHAELARVTLPLDVIKTMRERRL
jgi:hypothetical protein